LGRAPLGSGLSGLTGPLHVNVGRAIVESGRGRQLVAGRNPDHDVALPAVEGVADEAAPLRPPRIDEGLTLGRSEELDNLVVEPLAAAVAEREVVRAAQTRNWVRAAASFSTPVISP
jgi:hypothetical protein